MVKLSSEPSRDYLRKTEYFLFSVLAHELLTLRVILISEDTLIMAKHYGAMQRGVCALDRTELSWQCWYLASNTHTRP